MSDPVTPGAPEAAPAANPAADPAPTSQQPAATPATTEQPATPPAPAPEVIGDPAPTPAPEGQPQGEQFAYQETGDPGLDTALDFIGKLGLGPEHDAVKAAIDGSFDKLEATLAAMGDKATGYQRMLALAKDAYERSVTKTQATQAAVTTVVHEVAGGADQWAAIKDWAGKNADPAEKEAINAMLSAGPVQARAAATMLANAFRQAGGTVVTPASATQTNAANPASTTSGALSPAEYTQAVRELRAKLGGYMDGSKEYQALQARRAAWRG